MPRVHAQREAFTLVEVLVVLVIIGIAGAMVVPAMLEPGKMGVQAAARIVIADLLFAQNEAIAKQSTHTVSFDAANNRYSVLDATGTTVVVNWKEGSGAYVVNFKEDSRFQGVVLNNVAFKGGSAISFDALGSPSTGGSLQLTANGVTYVVSVAPLTGRVTVAPL